MTTVMMYKCSSNLTSLLFLWQLLWYYHFIVIVIYIIIKMYWLEHYKNGMGHFIQNDKHITDGSVKMGNTYFSESMFMEAESV